MRKECYYRGVRFLLPLSFSWTVDLILWYYFWTHSLATVWLVFVPFRSSRDDTTVPHFLQFAVLSHDVIVEWSWYGVGLLSQRIHIYKREQIFVVVTTYRTYQVQLYAVAWSTVYQVHVRLCDFLGILLSPTRLNLESNLCGGNVAKAKRPIVKLLHQQGSCSIPTGK